MESGISAADLNSACAEVAMAPPDDLVAIAPRAVVLSVGLLTLRFCRVHYLINSYYCR